jgi:hypothetical protein
MMVVTVESKSLSSTLFSLSDAARRQKRTATVNIVRLVLTARPLITGGIKHFHNLVLRCPEVGNATTFHLENAL